MEGDYVNGTVEEQAAPQTLQELQAAGVHAMPVVAGFQEALVAQAAQVRSLLPALMLPVQLRDHSTAQQLVGDSQHTSKCVTATDSRRRHCDTSRLASLQLQAAAGTPAGMTGDESTPGMHMGGSMSGRGRMSSGSFKNRSGALCVLNALGGM
jgi:hypothetical protein